MDKMEIKKDITKELTESHIDALYEAMDELMYERFEALEKYTSTNNQNIRIFNASAGAYKHPHQSIIATLFGKSFDLIISIEGFNEHYMLNDKIPKKIFTPTFRKIILRKILSFFIVMSKHTLIFIVHPPNVKYLIFLISMFCYLRAN